MRLYEECKDCLFNSQMKKVEREQTDKEKIERFKAGVREVCNGAPEEYCAPLLMRDIDGVHKRIFGCGIDYSREKALFNGKLLEMEEELFAQIISASDPLEEALKFSMAANYIDFARLSDLDEGAVEYVISAARKAKPEKAALNSLKNKLKTAKTLCVLHDNCGEIVLDKILIRVIKRLYPQISVTSVVRGGEIINDVTRRDAEAVKLREYALVLDNGTAIPGTYLKEISAETRAALDKSNVIISKGLGNLETLFGGGYAAFYSFACKCEHIAKRFNSELWAVVFTEETST